MMKAISLLPLVAAYQVMDTHNHVNVHEQAAHFSFDPMKEMLMGLSAKQQKGEPLDAATRETVEAEIKKITDELMGALAEDTSRTQSMLDKAHAEVVSCDTAKNNWRTTGWEAKKGATIAAGSAHDTCRGGEGGEGVLCATASEKCNTLTTKVCTEWQAGDGLCEKPGRDAFNLDSIEVETYMNCLSTFFKRQNGTYYSLKNECLSAISGWHLKSATCDEAQSTYETAYCAQEEDVENKCVEYRQCRDDAQAAYETTRAHVERLEDLYQSQRVALKALECYGEHILANSTDLSACEEHKNCCDLSDCPYINYLALPNCLSCEEPATNEPCAAGFLANYNKYDNTCTPVAQCSDCDYTVDPNKVCADLDSKYVTTTSGCPAPAS